MRKSLIGPIHSPYRLCPSGGGFRANPSHPMNHGLIFSYIFCEGGGAVVYDMSQNGRDGAITINDNMADMWRIISYARNDTLRAPIGVRSLAVNGTVSQKVVLPRPTVTDFTLISDHASLWNGANYPTDWGWDSGSYNDVLGFYPKHASYSSNIHFAVRVGGGTEVRVNPTPPALGERNVWAITRVSANGNVQFFKNGVSLAAAAASNTGSWALPVGNIGIDGLNSNPALPQMFRFEMYNRVLSATELMWHNVNFYPYGAWYNPRFVRMIEEENYYNAANVGGILINPDLKGGYRPLLGGF